ncbi:MAG: MarR family transcriptional regulator [Streptosporangiales bacterium]|nr:MarR family transcriptional regulator [Streptosporangiales bacterium]
MDVDHVDRMVEAWARVEPGLDVAPLEVAGRLLRCAALLERAIDEALRPLGLSFGDFDVINTLRRRGEPAGTNPKALASSALITSGAMTSRLDRLERAGLLERRPDPSDRRAILVRLTPAGEELAVRTLDAVLAADRRFLDPLSPDDRKAVAAALRRLLVRAEPG